MTETLTTNKHIHLLIRDTQRARAGMQYFQELGNYPMAGYQKELFSASLAEAKKLYLARPDAVWPECEWPAPERASATPEEKVMINPVNEAIDRLIHDCQHAVSGALLAASMGHATPAREMQDKARALFAQAQALYLANPGSEWPECEWPAPSFQIAEVPHD